MLNVIIFVFPPYLYLFRKYDYIWGRLLLKPWLDQSLGAFTITTFIFLFFYYTVLPVSGRNAILFIQSWGNPSFQVLCHFCHKLLRGRICFVTFAMNFGNFQEVKMTWKWTVFSNCNWKGPTKRNAVKRHQLLQSEQPNIETKIQAKKAQQ